MPTIKDSLYFNYDGKSCRDFGLIHINLDNGMFEETLVANRTINETSIRGSDTPLFHSVEEEPLEFQMAIAFQDGFTDDDIDRAILWLFQNRYKPLYFEDKPNKIYQCMPIGDSSITHNGLREGYVVINMRCKSSKIESPMNTTPTYDLSTNEGSYPITIVNDGHVEVFPEISIEKIGNGHVTIMNGEEIFEIRDLTNLEKIYINTEKEIIETDILGEYRYENVVGEFHDMALSIGDNNFTVQGKCRITFRYKLKYRF